MWAGNRVRAPGLSRNDSGFMSDQSSTSPTRSAYLTEPPTAVPYVSPLPPAVANVPKEDIRGFVHHKRVGNYLLGRTLGEGSFAKVKEGMHILTGEKVAIKVIDKKKAKDDSYVARNMRREAKLLQSVCHPNIIQLLEVIETDNSYYLVTELCSGGELMQHIYKQNHLEENEVRKFVRQIVQAVDHLHKANIIHRDLKVENLLLDANLNLRIIDFGLSNIYLMEQSDGSMEQCGTQCGSPAYAAPELLGHKTYGPEVDIWSIGVNMYAMLTGRLPFTVEPFNIAALHAKMLDNQMEPIPDHLSSGCKDLMLMMMNPKPDERVTMAEIMRNPWLSVGQQAVPFGPSPFPGLMKEEYINQEILEHMKRCLNVPATISEIKSCLMNNRAVQSSAIYQLLAMRLERYIKLHQPRRPHTRKTSQDDGFIESVEEEETIHLPKSIKRTGSLQPRRKQQVHMRRCNTEKDVTALIKGAKNVTSMPDRNAASRYQQRRQSLPIDALQQDLQKVLLGREEVKTRSKKIRKTSNPISTPLVGLIPLVPQDHMTGTSPPLFDTSSEDGGFISMRRNNSGELNAIRQALGKTVHAAAWTTQARSGSMSNSRSNSRPSSHYSIDTEHDELMFSDSGNHLRKENGFIENVSESRLPTIPSLPGSAKRRNINDNPSAPRRKNSNDNPSAPRARKKTPDSYELQTEFILDAFVSEVLRVLSNIKMLEFEARSSTFICCQFKGVRFNMTFFRGSKGKNQMEFEWVSGGNEKFYTEIRNRIIKMMVL